MPQIDITLMDGQGARVSTALQTDDETVIAAALIIIDAAKTTASKPKPANPPSGATEPDGAGG